MGVENGEVRHHPGEEVPVPPQEPLIGTPAAAERDTGQRAEEPVVVVTHVELEELQRKLAEAEAKLKRQRDKKNQRQQRWRDRHREHVREYDRQLYARRQQPGQ